MKQYRITSANFVSPGETGDPDAFMAEDELAALKRLAGIGTLGLLEDYTAGGHDMQNGTPNNADQDSPSPVGSNISITGMEKRRLEKANHIKVGSPEWFQLWFSKPYLTGEKPVGDGPAPQFKKLKNNNLDSKS
jgi:hypothetical protein